MRTFDKIAHAGVEPERPVRKACALPVELHWHAQDTHALSRSAMFCQPISLALLITAVLPFLVIAVLFSSYNWSRRVCSALLKNPARAFPAIVSVFRLSTDEGFLYILGARTKSGFPSLTRVSAK